MSDSPREFAMLAVADAEPAHKSAAASSANDHNDHGTLKCADSAELTKSLAAAGRNSTPAVSLSSATTVPSLLQKYLSLNVAYQNEATSTRPLLLQMANYCVSPKTIACLAEFVAQLNTSLVRLR